VVLIYEPPEADQVTVATNGIAWVRLDVKGFASHAGSAPEKGRNAALELSHQILQLKSLGNPEKGTSVNWTALQAGNEKHVNIIPDHASAIADMRMSDLTELVRVRQDAGRIIQNKLIPETEISGVG
jgi:glutamate carboxypeptidase